MAALAPGRFLARTWLVRLPLVAALGALAGLGQVPTSWPLAMLAALVLMMVLARRGAGFWTGWAFGAGHFALSLRWIVEPFLVEPEVTGWMAPFALILLAGGLAVFWGLPFWLMRLLRAGPFGLAFLWTGAEALRSLAFTGFPWALIGHVWTETPVIQVIAWTGVHGLTLLTLLLAAVIARLGMSPWQVVPLGVLAAAWLGLNPGAPPAADPQAPLVRIVQPNVPQAEKWDPALQPGHLARLLSLSGGAQADLVVWPETALTELLDPRGTTLAQASLAAGRATLAFGVARAEGPRYYNSLAVLDGRGEVASLYDKAHLVPFGEYLPFGDLLARWGLHGLAASEGQGFSSGPGPASIGIPGIGRAVPLICYEGIFAEEVATAAGAERPRLLLLVTNDAWFGQWAGPLQHFHLARLRAIEQGLPVVRAANTGISAMIDGQGRVLQSLRLGEAGAIEERLPPALAPTLYARFGEGPLAALGLIWLLGHLVAVWRNTRRD